MAAVRLPLEVIEVSVPSEVILGCAEPVTVPAVVAVPLNTFAVSVPLLALYVNPPSVLGQSRFCADESITFNVQNPSSTAEFNWTLNGQTTQTTSSSFIFAS